MALRDSAGMRARARPASGAKPTAQYVMTAQMTASISE